MTSLSSKLTVKVDATLSDALDLATASVPLAFKKELRLTDGTGANQADLIWHDTRSINASSNDDLDLAGELTDALGNTLTFAKVKALLIAADSGNGDVLNVGGEGTNEFDTWVGTSSDVVVVRPGGVFALFAPDATAYGVTASTGDMLRIANADSGGSASYDIVIIGTSA